MCRTILIGLAVGACAAGLWYYQTHYGFGKPAALSAAVIKLGEDSMYPDPQLTPGDILTTDMSVVCQPTYYRSVKDVPDSVKKTVYKQHNLRYPPAKSAYELDRFIPIELGGSNEVRNLWPEAGEPRPGYREKNAVENYLHAQVCTGQMSLSEAQSLIAADWYSIYLSISR